MTCGPAPLVQVVMLWLWLSYRFDPDTFPQRDKVRGRCLYGPGARASP